MRANRRLPFAVLFVVFLALTGCGEKVASEPKLAPTESKGDPEPGKKSPDPPVVIVPKDKLPVTTPATPPDAVAPTEADMSLMEELRKKGVGVYGPASNGGYWMGIERDTDPGPVLASLKGTKWVVGLGLSGDKVTDEMFKYLEGFDFLKRLTLHRCANVTGTGFGVLARLPRLETLWLVESPVTDAACKAIGQIKSLEDIRLGGTKITDAGLRELSGLAVLDSLSVDETAVTGSAFAVPGWAALKFVHAPRSGFDDAGLGAIAALPALESLNVDSTKVTDAGVRHLAGAKKLENLYLQRTVVGDAGATAIGNIKTLKELYLMDTKITDTGLAALAGLEALEELDVSGTAITGSGFAKFPPRPKLRRLTLANTKFDDAGGANLVKFPGLTRLDASQCRTLSDKGLTPLKDATKLSWCDLSGTAVGDDTAKLLGALPELHEARFVDTKLTDAGLKVLATAPKIRQIDARGTKVTKEGAERAKMGRKSVDIHAD